jgi:hypothetical protein
MSTIFSGDIVKFRDTPLVGELYFSPNNENWYILHNAAGSAWNGGQPPSSDSSYQQIRKTKYIQSFWVADTLTRLKEEVKIATPEEVSVFMEQFKKKEFISKYPEDKTYMLNSDHVIWDDVKSGMAFKAKLGDKVVEGHIYKEGYDELYFLQNEKTGGWSNITDDKTKNPHGYKWAWGAHGGGKRSVAESLKRDGVKDCWFIHTKTDPYTFKEVTSRHDGLVTAWEDLTHLDEIQVTINGVTVDAIYYSCKNGKYILHKSKDQKINGGYIFNLTEESKKPESQNLIKEGYKRGYCITAVTFEAAKKAFNIKQVLIKSKLTTYHEHREQENQESKSKSSSYRESVGIEIPRLNPTVGEGSRICGSGVNGRRGRATIKVGHLSYEKITSRC